MIEGIEPAIVAARPGPDELSALDHLRHLACAEEVETIAAAITRLDRRAFRLLQESRNACGWLSEAVHDGVHRLRVVARGLETLGAGAPRQRGTVRQINCSGGGVPKVPLESATVDRHGLTGDVQADRHHHGRPWQALSLWSQEVIDALVAERHPIHAGAAGENLTVSGIDWSAIKPGVRLAIGEVVSEVSAYATPCAKNARWFADGNFRRIDHNLYPGISRVYAWVVQGGAIATGADVLVAP